MAHTKMNERFYYYTFHNYDTCDSNLVEKWCRYVSFKQQDNSGDIAC